MASDHSGLSDHPGSPMSSEPAATRNERLASYVRRKRLELGMSKAGAARQAGLSSAKWDQMERGDWPGRPRTGTLLKVAHVLRTDPKIVFDIADMPLPSGAGAWVPVPDVETRLAQVEQDVRQIKEALSGLGVSQGEPEPAQTPE